MPGLAHSSAVSLESIDSPGHYLRHRDGEIWLEANDDSTAFAEDATWYQREGLADSDAESFESYNNTGQYILQRESSLYLSPIEANTDPADATFIEAL